MKITEFKHGDIITRTMPLDTTESCGNPFNLDLVGAKIKLIEILENAIEVVLIFPCGSAIQETIFFCDYNGTLEFGWKLHTDELAIDLTRRMYERHNSLLCELRMNKVLPWPGDAAASFVKTGEGTWSNCRITYRKRDPYDIPVEQKGPLDWWGRRHKPGEPQGV